MNDKFKTNVFVNLKARHRDKCNLSIIFAALMFILHCCPFARWLLSSYRHSVTEGLDLKALSCLKEAIAPFPLFLIALLV